MAVEVREVMSESTLAFGVAAAYLPLVHQEHASRVKALYEDLVAEAAQHRRTGGGGEAAGRGGDAGEPPRGRVQAAPQGAASVHTASHLEDGIMGATEEGGRVGDGGAPLLAAAGHAGGSSSSSPPSSSSAVAARAAAVRVSKRTNAVLHELLLDVSAALDCSRLDWLTVLYHMHAGALNSLEVPLDVATAPEMALPDAGLPALSFKPSRLRSEWPLAFVATNCHVQSMVVGRRGGGGGVGGGDDDENHRHDGLGTKEIEEEEEEREGEGEEDPEQGGKGAASTPGESAVVVGGGGGHTGGHADGSAFTPEGRYEWVTCGAAAAHACKFRSGGLTQMWGKIARIDEKLSTAGAKDAAHRHLRQRREWLAFNCMQREHVCVSQALGAIVTAIDAHVRAALETDPARLRHWGSVGLVIGWESLLSTTGNENKMLSDAWGSVLALRALRVRFKRRRNAPRLGESLVEISRDGDPRDEVAAADVVGEGGVAATASDGGVPPPSPLTVTLSMPSGFFGRLPPDLADGRACAVRVCLFSQGVNEAQTIANATGKTGLQEEINLASLQALEAYAVSFIEWAHPAAVAVAATKAAATDGGGGGVRTAAAADKRRSTIGALFGRRSVIGDGGGGSCAGGLGASGERRCRRPWVGGGTGADASPHRPALHVRRCSRI